MLTATFKAALWSPPTGRDVTTVQSGVRWLAVRAPERVSEIVLARLGEDSGAVVYDPFTRCAYWFISLGSADGWPFAEDTGIHVLSKTSWVAVPPRDWVGVPGLRWARHTSVGLLTNAGRLREALASALASDEAVSL